MAFALFLTSASDIQAQKTPVPEYQLKAAFLFNFAQFVDWPPAAFSTNVSPIVIGILGDDPFGRNLDDLVKNEKINGHPLEIQHFRQPEDVKTCHILFVSRSERRRLKGILADMKGRNILTVGDADDFCSQGGIIAFVTEKNKVRFKINPDAAKSAGLTISSKLLRLAEIVEVEKNN